MAVVYVPLRSVPVVYGTGTHWARFSVWTQLVALGDSGSRYQGSARPLKRHGADSRSRHSGSCHQTRYGHDAIACWSWFVLLREVAIPCFVRFVSPWNGSVPCAHFRALSHCTEPHLVFAAEGTMFVVPLPWCLVPWCLVSRGLVGAVVSCAMMSFVGRGLLWAVVSYGLVWVIVAVVVLCSKPASRSCFKCLTRSSCV